MNVVPCRCRRRRRHISSPCLNYFSKGKHLDGIVLTRKKQFKTVFEIRHFWKTDFVTVKIIRHNNPSLMQKSEQKTRQRRDAKTIENLATR